MASVTSGTATPAATTGVVTQNGLPIRTQGHPLLPWGNQPPPVGYQPFLARYLPLLSGNRPPLAGLHAPPVWNWLPPASLAGNQPLPPPPPTPAIASVQAEVRALDRKMDQIITALSGVLPISAGTTPYAMGGPLTSSGPLPPTSLMHPLAVHVPPGLATAAANAAASGATPDPAASAAGIHTQAPASSGLPLNGYSPFTPAFLGHGSQTPSSSGVPLSAALYYEPQQSYQRPIIHISAPQQPQPTLSSDEREYPRASGVRGQKMGEDGFVDAATVGPQVRCTALAHQVMVTGSLQMTTIQNMRRTAK